MSATSRFLPREECRPWFTGKTVAIVGSGPGSLSNAEGLIDNHDVVVRVNNYKLVPPATGRRTDVYYSFFGSSIRKTADELRRDGVKLCMCKCPDAKVMDSPWHQRRGQLAGVDFRYIYKMRRSFWFCDTYIPTTEEFLRTFNMLGRRVPTTGFSAILDVLSFEPAQVHLTGFDFFSSSIHNVNERWRAKNTGDPIGHDPRGELRWLLANKHLYPLTFDTRLEFILREAS